MEDLIKRLENLIAEWEVPAIGSSYSAHSEGEDQGYSKAAKELQELVKEYKVRRDILP
jgi:hypothetical protein